MLAKTSLGITCTAILGLATCAVAGTAWANPEFKLRGRLHVDYAVHNEDQVPLSDGALNRRARIGVQGTIDDHWSGVIEYDFAENGTTAADLILSRKLGGGTVKIGHFKVPMGFDELSSTNTIPFIERAAGNSAFVDARRLAVGYDYFSGEFGLQGILYSRGIGSANNPQGDEPIGIAGRLTYAPKLGEGLVHFGASVAYEDRQDFSTVRYRARPEANVDGNRLVDTGTISDVKSTTKYGLEAYWQNGPFSALVEYLATSVARNVGDEPDFSGWFVQGSWFLTGENRSYRNGTYRGVTPKAQGRGAWELVARYGSVDLNDSGFQGGEQDTLAFGLNYYSSANVRFMVNYILVDVTGSAAIVDGVAVGDDSPNILVARAQYAF
jgi:phosphate-selective porin OprO and OprP